MLTAGTGASWAGWADRPCRGSGTGPSAGNKTSRSPRQCAADGVPPASSGHPPRSTSGAAVAAAVDASVVATAVAAHAELEGPGSEDTDMVTILDKGKCNKYNLH
jgi:hypothetical protein